MSGTMGRVYKPINFPPLSEEDKKMLEALRAMSDEDINTDDIPEVDFSDATFYYDVKESAKCRATED